MLSFSKGRYAARMAVTEADLDRVLSLRALVFRGVPDATADRDALDAGCAHVMVEEVASGRLVCTFRLLSLSNGRELNISYAAQHYDLTSLSAYPSPMVEMGRFCVAPDMHDPDILRTAWAAITRHVGDLGVGLLFGCSSFPGTEPQAYLDAFAMLHDRHLAPRRWLPRVKAPRVFRFGPALSGVRRDPLRAQRAMPPLLRTYLMMGGWVSDHAVVDDDLGTLHVFTGVEVGKVPESRARLLRAAAS